MPCYAPLTAYYSKEIGSSGKRGITFVCGDAFSGVPLVLPCGQCVGCRLERARQWAVRCMHERKCHDDACFLSLTYDDDHLPAWGALVSRDLQLFHKRLHNRLLKSRGRGIRYYSCGEYGEVSKRPHYHSIVYDYDFPDKKFYKFNKRGEPLYTSAELEEIWPYGLCVIGDVTFDSAAYVAGYVVDKITGDMAEAWYTRVDADTGEIFRMPSEFSHMSRRPGIGQLWFQQHGAHAYHFDTVLLNGMEMRPPRYYDGLYELVDSARLDRLKKKRRRVAMRHLRDNTPDRRRVKEIIQLRRLSNDRRNVT